MKKIPKKQFDEVSRLSREYWETGEVSLLKERIKVAMEIRDVAGVDWLATCELFDSIVRGDGFLPGASDEMIYILLRVLGWEVVREDKESESL